MPRIDLSHVEKYRIKIGRLASTAAYGWNGAFVLPYPHVTRSELLVVVSDQMGWEHASVSVFAETRTPTWDEMCYVKNLFWLPEEAVIQVHPPESQYIRDCPFALHMWRPVAGKMRLPPSFMVGFSSEPLVEAGDAV